jgi:hypothetical protein
MFNFYWRFVQHAAAIIKQLTDTLKGGKSSKAAVAWSQERAAVFTAAKKALSNLC